MTHSPADAESARKWLKIAASHGSAPAAFYLGFIYEREPTTNRTNEHLQAAKWYRIAADLGDRESAWRLWRLWMADSINYKFIKNPPPLAVTEAEGRHWLEIAANHGHTIAMKYLAWGYGDPKRAQGADYSSAYFWRRLSLIEIPKTTPGAIAPEKDKDADDYAMHLNPAQKTSLDKRIAGWKPLPVIWPQPKHSFD